MATKKAVSTSPSSQLGLQYGKPAQPILAALLSGVGGLLLLIGLSAGLASFGRSSETIPVLTAAFIGLGFVTTLIVWLGGGMLISRPEEHNVWSWLILSFGLVGFGPWNFFGFYAIGSILAIAGGVFGLAFQPFQIPERMRNEPDTTPTSFLKKCVHCGLEIPLAAEKCYSCGKPQK